MNDFATGSIASVGAILIGGLVGQNIAGAISNSYAERSALIRPEATSWEGSVGYNQGGVISGSYATGNVIGGGNMGIGGLVGSNGNWVRAISVAWSGATLGPSSTPTRRET